MENKDKSFKNATIRTTQSNSPIKKKIKVFTPEEIDQIKQRKIQKEKSIEEKLTEIIITNTEKKSLDRVFTLLSNNQKYFDGKDIARILKLMDMHLTKSEIDLMIWVFALKS